MNLRQALTFVTVAELGSVSKAALQLRVAQPALSSQIIGLEQELDLRLFDRVGLRLVLTGEGEQLIAGSRLLLNRASSLKEQAHSLRQGGKGILKMAGSTSISIVSWLASTDQLSSFGAAITSA